MKKIILHGCWLVLVLSSGIINAETQYFYCGFANLDGTGQDYARWVKGGELSAFKYNKDKKRWEWITEYTYQYIYDNGKYEQIARSAIFDNEVGKCNKEMENRYKDKIAKIKDRYHNPNKKNTNSEDKEINSKAKKDARQKKIENMFSFWDGSHKVLERYIKKSMNDPDSYQHVETVSWDWTSHIRVKTTYKGSNVFGGTVTNWILVKVDINGNIIEILETGN